ncbi:hypothetical protein PAECIP112173_05050 [Paenibacillus sp. JJ-100]|uniref:HNH endonuclease n=1 Tax=Paenibacillus sp. JJ-100 TaxID=2974896 RepID=UPI0022FF557F|nr:HNH endonuclease signature motif containing protein [Paenibacillus sp. JJ-100]CAI6086594.1 hypothetical protein PAECIP112173_05050 [Paenibacillus sp. JJ-100]
MTINQKVNQEERAYRAWDVLIEHATSHNRITYKSLGEELGVHHRVCRYFLEHIQNYCLEHKLPPLTIIVNNQEGTVGDGFIAWDTDNMNEGIDRVFNFNWKNYTNPFTYAQDGNSEDQLAAAILTRNAPLKELYSQIKVRGIAQSIFRKALLEAYNKRCAFCGFRHEVALEAAHIIPWSRCNDEEKLSVNNGLLLCSNHHKLFDNDIIRVDENYTICTDVDFKSKVIGRKIRLPENNAYYPLKQNFERRRMM